MNHKRRHRVAGAAQRHHQQHDQQDRRHGEEDDAQIGERQRRGAGGRRRAASEARARRSSRARAIATATSDEEADRGADHAARAVDVLAPERLADQHRRRHAEAEHERHQQEHDHVGVGGRRQRVLAEEAADPDRVDRCRSATGGSRRRASAARTRAGSWRSAPASGRAPPCGAASAMRFLPVPRRRPESRPLRSSGSRMDRWPQLSMPGNITLAAPTPRATARPRRTWPHGRRGPSRPLRAWRAR